MAMFLYQARTDRGELVTGSLDADSENALDDALRARGLYVTKIRAEKPKAVKAPKGETPTVKPSGPARLKPRDLTLFTMHLATVLKSGLPLSAGLRNASEEAVNARIQVVAALLLDRIEEGKMLSEAMAVLPDAFPEYYVNLIRAGETVGHVDEVLFDLVNSLEWQQNLKADIKQAATYPIMMVVMLFAVALGIAIFVMPRLVTALGRTGMTLPTSALMVVAFGEFMKANWMVLVVGIAAAIAGLRLAMNTPRGEWWTDYLKLNTPLLGTLVRQVALSRFAHHLRMMVKAGVNFVVALNVVEHVVGNKLLAKAVADARERVVAGSSLGDALRSTGQFSPLVLQMVSTGEITGSLEETLKKVSEYYDREVPTTVKRISTAMEPVIYVVLGVVLVAVAMMLYSPLMSMLSQVNTRPRF